LIILIILGEEYKSQSNIITEINSQVKFCSLHTLIQKVLTLLNSLFGISPEYLQ
jgi:hypothetical protein